MSLLENASSNPKSVRLAQPKSAVGAFSRQIMQMIHEGRTLEVQEKLQSIFNQDPFNEQATYHSGQAFIAEKKPFFAVNKYSKFLDKFPASPPMATAKFRALVASGKFAEAKAFFEAQSAPGGLLELHRALLGVISGEPLCIKRLRESLPSAFEESRLAKDGFNVPDCSQSLLEALARQKEVVAAALAEATDASAMSRIRKGKAEEWDRQLNLVARDALEIRRVPEKDFFQREIAFAAFSKKLGQLEELRRIHSDSEMERYKQFFARRILEMAARYRPGPPSEFAADWPGQVEHVLLSSDWFASELAQFDVVGLNSRDREQKGRRQFLKIKAFSKGEMLLYFARMLNAVAADPDKQKALLDRRSGFVERMEREQVLLKVNRVFETEFPESLSFGEKLAFVDLEKAKNVILGLDSKASDEPATLEMLCDCLCRRNPNGIGGASGSEENGKEVKSVPKPLGIQLRPQKKQFHAFAKTEARQEVPVGTSADIQTSFKRPGAFREAFEVELAGKNAFFCMGRTRVSLRFVDFPHKNVGFWFDGRTAKAQLRPPFEVDREAELNGLKCELLFERSGCISKISRTKGIFLYDKAFPHFLECRLKRGEVLGVSLEHVRINLR